MASNQDSRDAGVKAEYGPKKEEVIEVKFPPMPLAWVFQKKHKTHFQSDKNMSQSLPKTSNTVGLYDGSAEARAIVKNAQELIDFELEGGGEEAVIADAILAHVMDYLKGKDISGYTTMAFEYFGPDAEPESEQ